MMECGVWTLRCSRRYSQRGETRMCPHICDDMCPHMYEAEIGYLTGLQNHMCACARVCMWARVRPKLVT